MKLCVLVITLISASVCLGDMTHEIGSWTVGTGFDNRIRYESMGDLRATADDTKNTFYNRLRIRGSVAYEKSFKLFVEGLDAREWINNVPRRGQYDDLDLHQAYLEAGNIEGIPLRAKIGRQIFNYGEKRILSAPTWSNKIRSFDAALIGLDTSKVKIDIFGGYIVTYEDNHFNDNNKDESLIGIYNTIKPIEKLLVDLYLLSQDKETASATGTTEQKRRTAGVRLNTKPYKGLTFDIEAAYQFGEDIDLDIEAYGISCYVEQSITAALDPSVRLEFNLASGDSDPSDNKSGTFIPSYQTTHSPYGIIDFFKWQNMKEIAIFCSLHPSKKLMITPEAHAYWLENNSDSWYRSSGAELWTKGETSDPGSFVGSELSLTVKQSILKALNVEAGYSAFFCGDVADEVSDEDTVHFGYLQMILTI